MVPDRHVIQVDGYIPPGKYTLIAGMYYSVTHKRLSLLSASGPFEGDNAALSKSPHLFPSEANIALDAQSMPTLAFAQAVITNSVSLDSTDS